MNKIKHFALILVLLLSLASCTITENDNITSGRTTEKNSTLLPSTKSNEQEQKSINTDITLELSFGTRTGKYTGSKNSDGLPDGEGTFTTKNDEGVTWTYEGSFVNGHFEGEGKTTWSDGQIERGVYKNDIVQPVDNSLIPKIYADPDSYKGYLVAISGQVFNVEAGYIQLYQNSENYSNNTIVLCEGADFQTNDYVKVEGIVNGNFEYENIMGGTMNALSISAKSVELSSYIEAVRPTIATYEVNAVAEKNGYIFTVTKVEFAEKETRVYIKVDNQGAGKLSIFTYSSSLAQNGRQYDMQSNYYGNYPSFQNDLRPGNYTEGIVCFPPLEQNDFKIYIEGYSDKYDQNSRFDEIEIAVNLDKST